jgi:hypothetical protein
LLHLLSVFHALLPPSSYTALLLLSKLFFYLLRSSSIGKDTQIQRLHTSFPSWESDPACCGWLQTQCRLTEWVPSSLLALQLSNVAYSRHLLILHQLSTADDQPTAPMQSRGIYIPAAFLTNFVW